MAGLRHSQMDFRACFLDFNIFTFNSLYQIYTGAQLDFHTEKKLTVSSLVKNDYDDFSRVFEIANQLMTHHSLSLAP